MDANKEKIKQFDWLTVPTVGGLKRTEFSKDPSNCKTNPNSTHDPLSIRPSLIKKDTIVQVGAASTSLSICLPTTPPVSGSLNLSERLYERFEVNFSKPPHNLQPNTTQATKEGKHPVSVLQELCTQLKWGPPSYNLILAEGPPHLREFQYEVRVNNDIFRPEGKSRTKKDAKTATAAKALEELRRRKL